VPQYGIFAKEMCKPAGIDLKLEILSQAQYYGSGDNQPWLTVPAGITDWASRGTASQTILDQSTLPKLECDIPETAVVPISAMCTAAEASAGATPAAKSTVVDDTP
jgi:hypothetical protein